MTPERRYLPTLALNRSPSPAIWCGAGLSESALQAYRVGQNVAWQRWMAIAFALTSDPDELRELLDVSARSLFEFVDATIAGIAEQIQIERDELTRGSHAERREAVALILDGAPISKHRAEARLGYGLDQIHTAAVVWGEPDCDSSQLDRATEALVDGADAQRPLSVIASAATRWVWIPGKVAPDLGRLEEVMDQMPGVRIAVGSTARGIEGFRRSHLDAVTTQRMLVRLNSTQRVAGFKDVELVSFDQSGPRPGRSVRQANAGKARDRRARSPCRRAHLRQRAVQRLACGGAAVYPPKHLAATYFPRGAVAASTAGREQRARRRRLGHGPLERQQRHLDDVSVKRSCTCVKARRRR